MTNQDRTQSFPTVSDGQSGLETAADGSTTAASDVASNAATAAKDAAGEVATQAKVVAGEAKRQIGTVVDQTRRELSQQADERTRQAAGGLRTLADQAGALAEGRPGDAGPLAGYLGDVQGRVSAFADRLETNGPQGLLDDVTKFARRRPIVFLSVAVGAGFMIGRLARAGHAVQQDGTAAASSTAAPASPAMELPAPTPLVDAPHVTTVP